MYYSYKDLEENGRGLIEILYRHLHGATERNLEQPQLEYKVSLPRFEPAPPECKYRALRLHKPALLYICETANNMDIWGKIIKW
jgi:hypothetical protein